MREEYIQQFDDLRVGRAAAIAFTKSDEPFSMDNARRTEIQTLLVSTIFVLLWPPFLWQGMGVVSDYWPALGEVDEFVIFLFFLLSTAIITLAFLYFVEIDHLGFASLGIVGPFISFITPAAIMAGSEGVHPTFPFTASFFAAGFVLGLVTHRYYFQNIELRSPF